MTDARSRWNEIYRRGSHNGMPAFVLTEHTELIPEQGRALDIACGKGTNAIYLASHGLAVDAWDISDVAIGSLESFAAREQLDIRGRVVDISADAFGKNQYDLVVNCHYLDRSIIEPVIRALKPGGLVFFQTFVAGKVANIGPKNPDFLLSENELPGLFDGFETVAIHDETRNPDTSHPLAGRVCYVGRKPR